MLWPDSSQVEKPNELFAARQRHRASKDKCGNIYTKLLPAHYYQYWKHSLPISNQRNQLVLQPNSLQTKGDEIDVGQCNYVNWAGISKFMWYILFKNSSLIPRCKRFTGITSKLQVIPYSFHTLQKTFASFRSCWQKVLIPTSLFIRHRFY